MQRRIVCEWHVIPAGQPSMGHHRTFSASGSYYMKPGALMEKYRNQPCIVVMDFDKFHADHMAHLLRMTRPDFETRNANGKPVHPVHTKLVVMSQWLPSDIWRRQDAAQVEDAFIILYKK